MATPSGWSVLFPLNLLEVLVVVTKQVVCVLASLAFFACAFTGEHIENALK